MHAGYEPLYIAQIPLEMIARQWHGLVIVALVVVSAGNAPYVPKHAETLQTVEGVTNMKIVVVKWPNLDEQMKEMRMKDNPIYAVSKYFDNSLSAMKSRFMDKAVVRLRRIIDKVRNFSLGEINWSVAWTKLKDKVQTVFNSNAARQMEMLKLSFMTFDQVRDYYNITDAPTPVPTPVQCPIPRLALQFQGYPYLYVTDNIARLSQPYPGYTMHHFGPPTTVPLVPAVGYPWPWNSSITTIATLLESDSSNNDSLNVGVMQAIDAIQKQFHIPTGLPLLPEDAPTPPFSSLSPPRSNPWRDAMMQFYGYPKTSGFKAITGLTWHRSSVTVFTPHLADALVALSSAPTDLKLRATHLTTLFDDVLEADVAALVYGIESPSTVWLSSLDRHNDEFTDACLGELILASRMLPTAQAAFDKMTRRSEQQLRNPGCLWDGYSAFFIGKMMSSRKPPATRTDQPMFNLAAHVALHVATRVLNLTATKAPWRQSRQTTVDKLLRDAVDMPLSAMGSNGVVHLGPQQKQPCVVLEKIKEPEFMHAVQRVLVRVGESSLLSAPEMDVTYACICLRVLGIHKKNEVVECIVPPAT
ncbi:hypothetical protein DYB30_001100 [Aphanomyces astaci]|uniref:Uncharacterized protein n=1 Tax=Aphanomyces astaci TaxID=112090 RepID=A0A397DGU0_APHAT|nr:hypothetical protein DYB34_001288 [Aphanomyces astaci]RHY65011.1 hypothetical protein DYB30_001100 [Aphanomyces astaci]